MIRAGFLCTRTAHGLHTQQVGGTVGAVAVGVVFEERAQAGVCQMERRISLQPPHSCNHDFL